MGIETKVIDNFIKDEDLFKTLQYFYTYKTPHKFMGYSSDPNKVNFYFSLLDKEDIMQHHFLKLISNVVKKNFEVFRMYLNIQHKEMDGDWHIDTDPTEPVNCTALLMIRGSGPFEIKNETIVDFVPNRFILFDAAKEHKGHAPDKDTPRITLAAKLFINNEDI